MVTAPATAPNAAAAARSRSADGGASLSSESVDQANASGPYGTVERWGSREWIGEGEAIVTLSSFGDSSSLFTAATGAATRAEEVTGSRLPTRSDSVWSWLSTFVIIPVMRSSRPSTSRLRFHGSTKAMAPTKTIKFAPSTTRLAHVDTLRILSLQTCSSWYRSKIDCIRAVNAVSTASSASFSCCDVVSTAFFEA